MWRNYPSLGVGTPGVSEKSYPMLTGLSESSHPQVPPSPTAQQDCGFCGFEAAAGTIASETSPLV